MYYSKANDKKFSDKSIVGIRAKAVRELRKITKGKPLVFGFYNHHVMIFDTPDFEKGLALPYAEQREFLLKHWVGDVGREIWANGKEYLMWYPHKGKDKGKRIYINEKGTVLRKE